MGGLVLSLFPGIGLLDMAFEEAGFCVVRGPDLLWGGDVHRFHAEPGWFDGIIGGPPCKGESALAHLNGKPGVTLKPEFDRVVAEARPAWWVMEAVKRHRDAPHVFPLSPRHIGEEQSRLRYFHSNLPLQRYIETELFVTAPFKHAVLAGHGGAVGSVQKGMAKYAFAEACRLQGLPAGFDLPGFTVTAKYEAVGNGVPLSMGRAVAKAVKAALAKSGSPDAFPLNEKEKG